MFEVGKLTVAIECPECEFTSTIRLEQVELEQQIICGGCLKTIQLRDAERSSARTIDNIEESLHDLDNILKRGLG